MRKSWWKVIGVTLVMLGLIAGMMVPLKPGITQLSTRSAQAGQVLNLTITGYNTRYMTAVSTSAYLRIDSTGMIKAKSTEVQSDQILQATFALPDHLPYDKEVVGTTLIVNTDNDGYHVLPDAVFIAADSSNDVGLGLMQWRSPGFDGLVKLTEFRFPHRPLLNETIRNTFYHITLWFSMFILLIAALVYSIRYLRSGITDHDIKAAAFTKVAVLFGVMGVITGSIWARFTWGAFWTTDVKLNMSATAMLIYIAYVILRGSITDRDRRARLSAVYNIFAFVALIPLVFVIPRLTDSLHPGNGGNPALGGEDMDHTMRMIFYPMIIGMTLLGVWITSLVVRAEQLRDKVLMRD